MVPIVDATAPDNDIVLWAESTYAFEETALVLMELSNNFHSQAKVDAPKNARVFNRLNTCELLGEQIATGTTKKCKADEDALKASTTSKNRRFQQPDKSDPTIQGWNSLELPVEPMAATKNCKPQKDIS